MNPAKREEFLLKKKSRLLSPNLKTEKGGVL